MVLLSFFGQVCRQEAPFVVAYVFHRPVGREPVGVHVEGAHKHAHLYGLPFDIFIFVSVFYDHNPAVYRTDDHVLACALVVPARTTEEVEYKTVCHRRNHRQCYRYLYGTQDQPCRQVEHGQHGKEYQQYIGSFAVDFHVGIQACAAKMS